MIGGALLILEAAVAQPAPAEAASGPFGVPALPEEILAEQRGGFRLPNGIDVSLSIDTVTAIDGRVVLQTVTRIAEGAPVVTAYASNGDDVAVPSSTGQTPARQGAEPNVTYDPQNGVTVTATIPSVSVAVTKDTRNGTFTALPGLHAVDLADATATKDGLVQRFDEGGRNAVQLRGADFSIMHFTGSALGSTILNTGDDRTIMTSTTLSIDLQNAGADVLGSALLRVEDIGNLAVGSRL